MSAFGEYSPPSPTTNAKQPEQRHRTGRFALHHYSQEVISSTPSASSSSLSPLDNARVAPEDDKRLDAGARHAPHSADQAASPVSLPEVIASSRGLPFSAALRLSLISGSVPSPSTACHA